MKGYPLSMHYGDELEFVPNRVDELPDISMAIRLLSSKFGMNANSSLVLVGLDSFPPLRFQPRGPKTVSKRLSLYELNWIHTHPVSGSSDQMTQLLVCCVCSIKLTFQ